MNVFLIMLTVRCYSQVGNVVEYGPCSNMFTPHLDEVVVDGVEHKRQRLEVDQHGHKVMDLVHGVSVTDYTTDLFNFSYQYYHTCS